jgi:ketosteroid isomerase-like protein
MSRQSLGVPCLLLTVSGHRLVSFECLLLTHNGHIELGTLRIRTMLTSWLNLIASRGLMDTNPLAIARACLQAYVDKDRVAIEALIADDYRFTSPIDNALNRKTYFELCWPNSKALTGFDYIYESEDGNSAFIVYEAHTHGGKTFRNSEVYTVRNGQLVATEVYFGWDLPHKAPKGKHIDNEDQ